MVKRKGEGKVARVGDFRGGDRGWSATRARHSRAARGERDCVGADRGRRSRAVVGPPSGAGWDSGQARCRSEGVRARVLTTNGF
jgi:hypothetical protein